MSLHRKIFLTIALVIAGISAVYVTLTHFIVKRSVEAGIQGIRGAEVAQLAQELSDYYIDNHRSWEGAGRVDLLQGIDRENPSVFAVDNHNQVIVRQGDAPLKLVSRLGVRKDIVVQGEAVGQLSYYDPEVANFNKILIGIPISVVIVLIGGGIALAIAALLIAYRLSRWLASPLTALLPTIERLGRGELGVQARVTANDEYGKIAAAFNEMSRKLEQSEKLRRNATADIAHELRTPLTIVGGKLEELQQRGRPVPPERLLPLQDELIRLNRLVEDLRTLSLAESGALTLHKTETDLADLARSLCSVMEPLAEEKELSIRLEVLADRTTIVADPGRIRQVLVNLLTNAIRHSPKQGTVRLILRNDDDRRLTLIVQDDGIGIAPEHVPYIFDRFYRADEARARESGGTGLGLAIAKQFVLLHRGTIEAESKLHEGTRLTVRLPY